MTTLMKAKWIIGGLMVLIFGLMFLGSAPANSAENKMHPDKTFGIMIATTVTSGVQVLNLFQQKPFDSMQDCLEFVSGHADRNAKSGYPGHPNRKIFWTCIPDKLWVGIENKSKPQMAPSPGKSPKPKKSDYKYDPDAPRFI